MWAEDTDADGDIAYLPLWKLIKFTYIKCW